MSPDRHRSEAAPSRSSARAVVCWFVIASVGVGCGAGTPVHDTSEGLQVERVTDGNTTLVRNLAGSTWAGPAKLIEELSIGVLEGQDPYMFGRISSVWATDERIYVVDSQAPAMRTYDHQGSYLGDLGRPGDGPGEYQNPGGVSVQPDGTVVLQETFNNRLTFYPPGGGPARTWAPDDGGYLMGSFTLSDGTLLLRRADPPENRGSGAFAWIPRDGVAELDDEGELGPMRYPPDFGFHEEPLSVRVGGSVMSVSGIMLFRPAHFWTVTPDGSIVAGVSNQYRFEIDSLDGGVTSVERTWNPVPVPAGHAAWVVARVEGLFRRMDPDWRYDGEVPTTKPAFRNLIAGRDGRIWVVRAGASEAIEDCFHDVRSDPNEAARRPCWRDRSIIDVFAPSGEYLGELQRPENLTFQAVFIQGDTYLAAVEDENGLVMVKKFRLQIPVRQ